MKIRSGFVSNSSSSSFLVIMKKEDYQKVASTFTPVQKALANHFNITEKKILDTDCVIYKNTYGNYGYSEWLEWDAVEKEAIQNGFDRDLDFRGYVYPAEQEMAEMFQEISIFSDKMAF